MNDNRSDKQAPSCSVLFVDDEEELVGRFVERMRRRGLRAVGASSGEDALALLEQYRFDVVVLDVSMPRMGGIEVLIEVKQLRPEVAVLMTSGWTDVDTAIRGFDYGAFDYLVKPLSADELIDRIEGAFRSARASATALAS